MAVGVRLWEILSGDELREIKSSTLDMEQRIENWLKKDISVISNDLLVIGCQVPTDFGGFIDLLCIERTGDLVIVELKREKTPREVTAQILDYASWVKDLSHQRITAIADGYFGTDASLEEAFKNRFQEELPDILNEHHKMLVVASKIDSGSERIINYLSDTYGVSINAATFEYFRDEDGKELLARVFLLEPSDVEYKSKIKSTSGRKPPLTYQELEAIAEDRGVRDLYRRLFDGLTKRFDQRNPTRSSVAFVGFIRDSRNTIFSLLPEKSDSVKGVAYAVYVERFLEYFKVDKPSALEILPAGSLESEPGKTGPATMSGFFPGVEAIEKFLSGLDKFKQTAGSG